MDIASGFIAARHFALGFCNPMDSIVAIIWAVNQGSLSIVSIIAVPPMLVVTSSTSAS